MLTTEMFRLIVFLIAIGCVLGINDFEEKKRLRNKHLELWDTLTVLLGKTRKGKQQKLPSSIVNVFEKSVKEGVTLDKASEAELNKMLSKFALDEMKRLYALERRNYILRMRNKCNAIS